MAKKTIPFPFPPASTHPNHPLISSTRPKDQLSTTILVLTSSLAAVLPLIPRDKPPGGGGHGIPTIVFRGLPSIYYAFVVSIMIAFSSAFSALVLFRKPKAAAAFRFSGIACMSFAFGLFGFSVFCNYLS